MMGMRPLFFLLVITLAGCATVRSSTMPGTFKEIYHLQGFDIRPPSDPSWRLAEYDPWRPFVAFQHADLKAKLAAWWFPAYPEEIRHSKAETVLTFFRDDLLEQLKLSGDFEIKGAGEKEETLQIGDRTYQVLHIEGLQGEKKDPFEAWLAYRDTGSLTHPQLEVFSYLHPLLKKELVANFDPADYRTALQELLRGAINSPQMSRWMPWKRATGIYNRFLSRHPKRNVAEERPRLEALYQAAQREVQDALRSDPNRPELHDLLGLLACYNDPLEFLGPGFDVEAAERAFHKAISLRENEVFPHEHLANMLKAQERFEEALKEYQALTEISPSTAEYYYQQGKLLEKSSRPSEALHTYQQALRFWIGAEETKEELKEKVRELGSKAAVKNPA